MNNLKTIQTNIKTKIKFVSKFIIIPLVIMLGACSTTYTPEVDKSSQYDFASVETFNVIGDDLLRNPMISDMDRARLDSAIETSLESLGKSSDDQGNADILVSYFIVTKDKVKVNSSYGGAYHAGCYRCGYRYGAGTSHVNTKDYVEGTLVLDIIDNETKKSVYRSTLVKPLKSYDSIEEREQAINKMVESMIQQLPVS